MMYEIERIANLITEDPDLTSYAVAVVQGPDGRLLLQQTDDGWKFPGTDLRHGEDLMGAAGRCCSEFGLPAQPVKKMPLAHSDTNFVLCKAHSHECGEDMQWMDKDDACQRDDIHHQAKELITSCMY